MTEEIFEKTFTVATPLHLLVSNIRGAIHIFQRAGSEVLVKAIKHHNDSNANHTYIEIEQTDNDALQIRTRLRQPPDLSQRVCPCAVTYSISVPVPVHIKLHGVSSTVDLQDLEGDFDLKTVSGDMSLKRLTGPMKIATVSGHIFGEALCGALTLKTVSGNIHLDESTLSTCEITTTSGEATLKTPLGKGPYNFHSLSGDVRLVVPPQAGCEASSESLSGKFFCDLSTTYIRRQGRLAEMIVQDSGAIVHHDSLSGNMWITT
jgi:DUF4097 and DUF4098 domain-containing protein YvlB